MDRSVREAGVLVFGPFRLDPARRTLSRDGEVVSITPTVFDTLLHLAENTGRVVTKDELLEAIWPGRVVEESNVSQTIFTLRKALGRGSDGAPMIVTAPGRGYRFAAPVRREGLAGAETPPPLPTTRGSPAEAARAAEATAIQAPPGSWRPTWRMAALAGGLAALALAAGWAILVQPWRPAPPPGGGGPVVLAAFRNLTGEPIFDGALAKALQIDLVQSPFVSVLSDSQVADILTLMTRPRDERLTPAIAAEVCARSNGRAVVEGTVAAMGARYLLTLTATDCAGSRTLAAEKIQVDRREAVIDGLDTIAKRVRAALGESAGSVTRFDLPLARKRTASLEALKAYSEASYLFNHGKVTESIGLFQRAIDLDPNFVGAYADLARTYANLNQVDQAAATMTQAYRLRAAASEWDRFSIISQYHRLVTKDINAAIRNSQDTVETYPLNASAWGSLASARGWIGQYAGAIEAGRRALALDPTVESAYTVLAQAYVRAGRLDEAADLCARANARGLAGEGVHAVLQQIAFARNDEAAAEREMAWARGKPAERALSVYAAVHAYAKGQVRRGDALYEREAQLAREQGLSDHRYLASRAYYLADLGLKDEAEALLGREPPDADTPDYRFMLMAIGDAARAQAMLARDLAQAPADTLLNAVYAPEERAALAMRQGHPAQAVAALAPALPYAARNFDVPYQLGRAYLAAGDGARAAASFRSVVDHPGIDPGSPQLTLARLGLARALRLSGDAAGARREYQALLAAWKDADPDLPVLLAAKAEYARL
jgi:DNA-binding winged helix-turn-helix (wHTH) protein/tetratricopeptide (TPR) repeat protein